jgi:hypothetical protein
VISQAAGQETARQFEKEILKKRIMNIEVRYSVYFKKD